MTAESENNKKLRDFFEQEYHSLKSYVNSRLKTSVNRDPEDIIQDVALKLFSGADRYSPINNVAGFVYHSIRNKIIDIMRVNLRMVSSEEESETRLIEFMEILYDHPDNSYSEQMKHHLKEAIMDLKPEYRNVIMAVDFEGCTYKEMSFETGIPEGTLMSRRHRALSLLNQKLETKINYR